MKKNNYIFKLSILLTYFLMGACYILVGTTNMWLVEKYDKPLEVIVLLSSFYAFGRIFFAFIGGILAKKFNEIALMCFGEILFIIYIFVIYLTDIYVIALIGSFVGGCAMGMLCITGPDLLSSSFGNRYESALSAGQSFMGFGMFFTPLLVTLGLRFKLPYAFTFISLIAVSVLILVASIYSLISNGNNIEITHSKVTPIKVRNKRFVFIMLLLLSITYSAIISSISNYTIKIISYKGYADSYASLGLTLYNVGSLIGGIVFIFILKRVKTKYVLLTNFFVAIICIFTFLISKWLIIIYPSLFISGFMLGVLFGPMTDLAMRIYSDNTSIANSYMSISGGVSEIATPLFTGYIMTLLGIGKILIYTFSALVLGLVLSIVINIKLKDT